MPTAGRGSYGFGWRDSRLGGDGGARVVWHAGATASSFSHIVLVPDSDLAVVVLANAYHVALDGPLTSLAFDTVRLLRGEEPDPAPADATLGALRTALLAVAAVLAVLVAWSVRAAVRAGARGRSRRRRLAGAAAWVAGCAAVAATAGWLLPSFRDGAGLAQVLLFAPDVGHTAVAVVVLAVPLAGLRVVVAARG